ncbi:MAG: hypothetical protein ACTHK7_22980 [Aureliella sp.]
MPSLAASQICGRLVKERHHDLPCFAFRTQVEVKMILHLLVGGLVTSLTFMFVASPMIKTSKDGAIVVAIIGVVAAVIGLGIGAIAHTVKKKAEAGSRPAGWIYAGFLGLLIGAILSLPVSALFPAVSTSDAILLRAFMAFLFSAVCASGAFAFSTVTSQLRERKTPA